MLRSLRLGAVVAWSLGTSLGAFGQSLTISKLEPARFDELIEPSGSPQKGEAVVYEKRIKAPAGQVLLDLAVTVDARWDDGKPAGPLQVSGKAITFAADGQPATFVGLGAGEGVLAPAKTPGLFLMPPMTPGQPKVAEQTYHWVVAVPREAKRVEVRVGQLATGSADVPQAASKVDPTDWLTIEIRAARLVDTVPGAPAELKPAAGERLILVDLVYTPKKANAPARGTFPASFVLYSHALNVRAADKTAGVEGYAANNTFFKPGAFTSSSTAPQGKWIPTPLTAVFKVPATAKTFDLLYTGRPAAKGDVR